MKNTEGTYNGQGNSKKPRIYSTPQEAERTPSAEILDASESVCDGLMDCYNGKYWTVEALPPDGSPKEVDGGYIAPSIAEMEQISVDLYARIFTDPRDPQAAGFAADEIERLAGDLLGYARSLRRMQRRTA